MPSKPANYGIKSWVACDARSSYASKMQVYTGKPSGGRPERNLGLRVVLDLTEGLSGRNVACDNYFTSYELARQLLERTVTVVGTVRKNKPELPPRLLAVKGRAAFSSLFAFTPAATLVSYVARKKNRNVVLNTRDKGNNKNEFLFIIITARESFFFSSFSFSLSFFYFSFFSSPSKNRL